MTTVTTISIYLILIEERIVREGKKEGKEETGFVKSIVISSRYHSYLIFIDLTVTLSIGT